MKRDLRAALFSMHITAEFEVVEMGDTEISAYTVERTIQMEQRAQLLKALHLDEEAQLAQVQHYADKAHEAAAKASARETRGRLAPVPENQMLSAHARATNPEKNLFTFSAQNVGRRGPYATRPDPPLPPCSPRTSTRQTARTSC